MSLSTPKTESVAQQHCGKWNTDVAAGWEVGLLGKERIGNKLYHRNPPGHFFEPQNKQRYLDWLLGRDRAMAYVEAERKRRYVMFHGKRNGEFDSVTRRGWRVSRSSVISQMARAGFSGDITVHYYLDGKEVIEKQVTCGI